MDKIFLLVDQKFAITDPQAEALNKLIGNEEAPELEMGQSLIALDSIVHLNGAENDTQTAITLSSDGHRFNIDISLNEFIAKTEKLNQIKIYDFRNKKK